MGSSWVAGVNAHVITLKFCSYDTKAVSPRAGEILRGCACKLNSCNTGDRCKDNSPNVLELSNICISDSRPPGAAAQHHAPRISPIHKSPTTPYVTHTFQQFNIPDHDHTSPTPYSTPNPSSRANRVYNTHKRFFFPPNIQHNPYTSRTHVICFIISAHDEFSVTSPCTIAVCSASSSIRGRPRPEGAAGIVPFLIPLITAATYSVAVSGEDVGGRGRGLLGNVHCGKSVWRERRVGSFG